jgi:hypothetical protein
LEILDRKYPVLKDPPALLDSMEMEVHKDHKEI